jgi:hypothetical protein
LISGRKWKTKIKVYKKENKLQGVCGKIDMHESLEGINERQENNERITMVRTYIRNGTKAKEVQIKICLGLLQKYEMNISQNSMPH